VADKIFRDALYNYIALDKTQDKWLIKLLNSREVQRLRRIHQLGVSNYTYPGAEHTRLAHSLGVVHLMLIVLNHLGRNDESARVAEARKRLLAAALLHDVGHGPFSHLFEPCLGIDHEEWSIAVIKDEHTEVHKILKTEGLLNVVSLIQKKSPDVPAWQKALISSELDVDRLDYIRRDSFFTGAGYGHFDWYRLLTCVEFYNEGTELIWPEKAALALEEYIFARYYMYQNVYLHKTTRGIELILRAMWRRADKIRKSGDDINPVPVLEQFWKAEKPAPDTLAVADYLNIEEFTVLEQIQRWTAHKDKSMADLANRFLYRDGFAMVKPPVPANQLADQDEEWEAELGKLLKKHPEFTDLEMYLLIDQVPKKYLQPYREEKAEDNKPAATSIRILSTDGEPQTIGQHLPRLKSIITPPKDALRYYVPKKVRQEAFELSRKMTQDRQKSYSSTPL
jgi:uncharacterized protein